MRYRTWKWEYPEIAGKHPVARFGHSMHYFKPLYSLVIHGGRNDNLKIPYLNDLIMLNCYTMSWT